MQLCRVEHLLEHFSTYLSSKLDSTLCNQNIGEGESNIDDKYVEKVFNKCSTRQSCVFPKFTSFEICTLGVSNPRANMISIRAYYAQGNDMMQLSMR